VNRFVMIIASCAFITGIAVVLTWAFWLRVKHPTFMSVSALLANTIGVIVAFVPEVGPRRHACLGVAARMVSLIPVSPLVAGAPVGARRGA
jgi:hypothetical protein